MIAVYVLAKTVAYGLWCLRGVRQHRGDLARPRQLGLAALLGALRAALGIGFGLGIWLGSSAVAAGLSEAGLASLPVQILTYLAVYVPVRVIEWGLVGALGLRALDWQWILGGIGVSVLCDLPMIFALRGLPLGRFMC